MRSLVVKEAPADTTCRCCDDGTTEALVVIGGGANCHYCGNELHLCAAHFEELRQMMNQFGVPAR